MKRTDKRKDFIGSAVVAAVIVLMVGVGAASVAQADAMWPGECRVQTEDYDGDTEWFAWRNVQSCEPGLHRGQVEITFIDGNEVTQWLGEEVIKLQFKPFPQGYQGGAESAH